MKYLEVYSRPFLFPQRDMNRDTFIEDKFQHCSLLISIDLFYHFSTFFKTFQTIISTIIIIRSRKILHGKFIIQKKIAMIQILNIEFYWNVCRELLHLT